MTSSKSTDNFFADLEPFSKFREFSDLAQYSAFPDDWTLLATDIVDSTGGIERGDYKTINMVGAASIKCVLNVSCDVALPFVFGGDGGLIAVPPSLAEGSIKEVARLQAVSRDTFGYELRAAAIPVHALRSFGADISVKKHELSDGNFLAMFGGSGPILIDEWLKTDANCNGYALPPIQNEPPPDLEGLSCRWSPVNTRNGVMFTLIVLPNEDDPQSELVRISESLGELLGGELSNFAPISASNTKFRFPPSGIALELASSNPKKKLDASRFLDLLYLPDAVHLRTV